MRARALTLIEVVASLALVGGTVAALLTAHARSLEQLRTAREQHIASNLAHERIAAWKIDPETARGDAEGDIDSHPGWQWKRQSRPYTTLNGTVLEEVTLTIYRTENNGHQHPVTSYTWLESQDEP